MQPQDKDDKLLDWISGRLLPDRGQDAARIEKLLAVAASTPFTEVELSRILQKARGESPLRTSEPVVGKNGFRTPNRPRQPAKHILRFSPVAAWAAAACLLVGVGWIVWTSPPADDAGTFVLRPAGLFTLANGHAILRPNSPTTKVFLVNADKGQVRLEQGGVYLQLPAQANIEAEVQTPVGRLSATDTRCFIYYLEKAAAAGKNALAVLVLDGQVQVNTSQGFEIAEAGELIVAEMGANPERISPTAFASEDQDWTEAQDVLLLLHNPEILDQLKLNLPQKEKLTLPTPADIERVDDLLRILNGLPPAERKKRTGEYFTYQAKQMESFLDEPQKKELKHICIQHAGFSAMLQKDVCKLLNLSQEQQKSIQAQLYKFGSAKQGLFLHGGGTSLDLSKNLAKLQQQQADSIFKMLKPDQCEHWNKMHGKGESSAPGFYGLGQKGFGFNLYSQGPKTEEQLWDAWLMKTAKRVNMTPDQLTKSRALLQEAKHEAAEYRRDKQADFKQLATDFAMLQKSMKYDKTARQALEQKAEVLQLPLAEIGEDWKQEVRELLTSPQRKALEQVGKTELKELPPNMGFHGFWDKLKKIQKKGPPGKDKHK